MQGRVAVKSLSTREKVVPLLHPRFNITVYRECTLDIGIAIVFHPYGIVASTKPAADYILSAVKVCVAYGKRGAIR
ncbi:Hypothetical protein NGAL_HAMBI490_18510 [Neorhizobium galegae bv. officinalis]|nr:Hypothetical protein NGAL_HAMBI490_18510 [Neorhizobium galegae bv. officinalis]